uniref:Transposase Tc1-like domain-containing protein n=1 Tax=Strigamia maritima TaxID=126957 RepID=T1JL80_STRMM
MGARKKLTEAELGLSNVKIGNKIERSEKVIRNFLRLRANYALKNSGGRPKSTSRHIRNLVIHKASNKCTSACAIKSECDLNCSVRTIQRVLKNIPHLKYTKPKRKPALKLHHIQARLSWAEKKDNVTVMSRNFDGGSYRPKIVSHLILLLLEIYCFVVFAPWAKVLSRTVQDVRETGFSRYKMPEEQAFVDIRCLKNRLF